MTPIVARGTTARVLLRPWLIPAAIRGALAMAKRGWWRRWPFLPVPDDRYWAFRMETASGGDGSILPTPDETLEVIEWTAQMRRRHR
ncbi:MAG: hypothetical protein WCI12_06025 [Actinomycetes bacterium]